MVYIIKKREIFFRMAIIINSNKITKHQHNFWNNLHFHPTDAIEDEWGKRILDEVAKDGVANTVRMYAMLEDIVTEKDGVLHYDFTENDVRLDYMVKKGFNILLSYNFLPPFLSLNPENNATFAKNKTRYKGKYIVASIPRDYTVWQEICRVYTEHILERYGEDIVSSWYLQCYNEPDISFFMAEAGKLEEGAAKRLPEYIKLYKGFANGTEEAFKNKNVTRPMKIGGPALAHYLNFFEGFLEYIKASGTRLDFICTHTYGTHPDGLTSGEKPLNIENTYEHYIRYRKVIDKYFPDTEFIFDEWGACSGGFVDCETHPKMIFRETEIFSAYYAKMITRFIERDVKLSKMLICLSGQHEMTWDFMGFRHFISLNFIKKPIYNAYILGTKLYENILSHSETENDITLLATKNNGENYSLLLSYSSDNFDKELPDICEKLRIEGIENGTKNITVYRIDKNHTNPYTLFCKENFPKDINEEQIGILRNEGTLKAHKKFSVQCTEGLLELEAPLSNNSVLLIQIE